MGGAGLGRGAPVAAAGVAESEPLGVVCHGQVLAISRGDGGDVSERYLAHLARRVRKETLLHFVNPRFPGQHLSLNRNR